MVILQFESCLNEILVLLNHAQSTVEPAPLDFKIESNVAAPPCLRHPSNHTLPCHDLSNSTQPRHPADAGPRELPAFGLGTAGKEDGNPIIVAPPWGNSRPHRSATRREKGSTKKGLSFLMANEEAEARLSDPPPSHPAPTDDGPARSQIPNTSSYESSPDAAFQMFTMTDPALIPGMVLLQNTENNDHGPGIYAVPVHPFMGPMIEFPPNTLIPLKYNIPTRENSGAAAEQQGQVRQQQGPQRQVVVRRFHFAFHLDLVLIIKLAAVVFLLNPDGSRQRLFLLMFFASLVYLYQTGALNPVIRWIRRAGAPPQPRPPVQPDNGPPVARDDGNNPQPGENPAAENQNQNQNVDQPMENQDPPAANENQREPEAGNGFNWWGIVKEIQLFVVGFVASLLPGYHNND
ncbi:uncharacterized protein [Elaeis guineensis]|uniref:Uncharacterized protein LOC105039325 isoform X1 n=1 Tax=Elaeis guineensis var. tenera TaxID=51953 RepID=A0A6I9QUZ4_ELAGV|nr:uncharacterized protein LOC105039325 isoform X1 [Elaeis guineensis]